ncbi:WecB/TagA/CpsF family glycosyltransferase [Candidatus Parcubacteria bacterium]|nr:WecB/TagA/CpsF family glycosyltransferase [Candidatus Parcubacteria bacterium]
MCKNDKNVNIIGINFLTLKKAEIISCIEKFVDNKKQYTVFTPNPEIILKAISDEEYFYILTSASLLIPDGIGLKFAALASGKNLQRFTGVALTKIVLKIAEKKRKKVLILNWRKGLARTDEIIKNVNKQYPKLDFFARSVGRESEITKEMKSCKADILFVNFGAPYQEKYIYKNLKKLPTVHLAIGVGGSFDFLIGKIKRAPKFMRYFGFEWLWRLIQQPERIKRIYNAVFVFPFIFLRWKFWNPFFYRKNVACLLYKKENNSYKIFIMRRNGETDAHWQIPQGGLDNEDLLIAGERELREELNCNKFKTIKTFKNIHKYKFGERLNECQKRAKRCKRHSGFKGQKQGLLIAKFLGNDEDIKVNYWDHDNWKWVDYDKVIDKVHPVRKEAMQKFLEKFKECVL